jgi:predicted TIM-barrel fold metal-dependent hydrolase
MLRIFDAHVHLFDRDQNIHEFLEHEDPGFKSIAGDYSALPRRYAVEAYLHDSASCQVEGIAWYEFLSNDPVREVRWAQQQRGASTLPQGIVARVDFLDPMLEQRLQSYAALPEVVAVREHLGWDDTNPLRRFAQRRDLLTDRAWREGLGKLRRHGLKCVVELFSPQLSDLCDVARLYPDIAFELAVMGWPLDLSPSGFARWRQELQVLSRCANVCVEIAAVECIFGRGWRTADVAPWILCLIELFGPQRCMFGSHMPIASLSSGFERLYAAYGQIVCGCSADEQDRLFRGTAAAWFTPTRAGA